MMSMLRLDYAKSSHTFGSYHVPAEALENGWVNWSGLATLLSEMTDTLADPVSTLSVHL